MFPPNSLKTLMDLKLTKDIQDNPSFYEEKSEARILLKSKIKKRNYKFKRGL